MRSVLAFVFAAISLSALAAVEPWEAAVDRAAVVFDRSNGPGCTELNRIGNGSVETNAFLTGCPAYMMPVGAGNLSAMVAFGDDSLEIILSKADDLDPKPVSFDDQRPQLVSPGRLTVKFDALSTNLVEKFAQKMDMKRGRVCLGIRTQKGDILAEIFGDRATGALVLFVDDRRSGVAAPKVAILRKLPALAVLCDREDASKFRLVIGADEKSAKLSLMTDEAALTGARDRWWRDYWKRGWISLEGDENAKNLERRWYVNLYAGAKSGDDDADRARWIAASRACSSLSPLSSGVQVEDTVSSDGSGAMQTAVQELLLQSHPQEPATSLPEGGPVRFLPCVPKTWSGAFRLLARGGFVVEVAFKKGALTKTRVESTRGGMFRWIDPATGKVEQRATHPSEIFNPLAPKVLPWDCDSRVGGQLVRGKGCLYAVGGGNTWGKSQIVRIELGADGLPNGQASVEGEIQRGGVGSCSAAIVDRWLYCVGGDMKEKAVRFTIGTDGHLSDCTEFPASGLPRFSGSAMVASGRNLVIMGGWQSRLCYAAEVKTDGSLGAWTKQRPLTTISFSEGRAFRVGNRIYVSGNPVYKGATDRVYATQVDEKGFPTKWRRFAELPEESNAYRFTLMPDGKSVHYVNLDTGNMYVAPIVADDEIGDWMRQPGSFPTDGYISMTGIPLTDSVYLRYNALIDDPRIFVVPEYIKMR